jgi:hypothetical protein
MFKKRPKKTVRLTREEMQARRLLEKEMLAQERSNNRALMTFVATRM